MVAGRGQLGALQPAIAPLGYAEAPFLTQERVAPPPTPARHYRGPGLRCGHAKLGDNEPVATRRGIRSGG
eukprot:3483763-Lingulodinium_polyedra.AAC.1